MLSANTAYYGQGVTLSIRHFSPLGRVSLTYDAGEALQIDSGQTAVPVAKDGSADVVMHVDSSWGPGLHTIAAEDTRTHYVAHASLQVVAEKVGPAHLMLVSTQLDLGVDMQGANTVQAFKLSNSGGMSISWSASSDQPWLLLTPAQGHFGDTQTIAIAGQRTNLSPGEYIGQITFASNTGLNQMVHVEMRVNPIPAAGAVLSVSPPVFSFMAIDGGGDPGDQPLIVSNPGSQPLYWSLGNIVPSIPPNHGQPSAAGDAQNTWVGTDLSSGMAMPDTTSVVHLVVHDHNLAAGTYLSTLIFMTSMGHTTLDTAQYVTVSLIVQPHCDLTLSTGSMFFTTVAGQNSPSNQVLSFSGTGNCPAAAFWQATSSAPWLLITPASGQLKDNVDAVVTVGVNAAGLKVGTYTATITLTTVQATQSVPVQLAVQQTPSLAAPIMAASPLALNFSTTQGQNDPPGQSVTLTNTGGNLLVWYTSVSNQAASWLTASTTGSSIPQGQTAQLTINVKAGRLAPGSYVGQVSLYGFDAHNVVAAGSPQTITVNFAVQAPCMLSQLSSSSLAFSTVQATTTMQTAGMTQAASNSSQQSVSISVSGNCNWPIVWKAKMPASVPWLQLSPSSGTFDGNSGQSSKIVASLNNANLAAGVYQAQISVSAVDAANMPVQGGSQVFTVSLTVQQPCAVHVSASTLSFSLTQGSPKAAVRQLTLSETGNCTFPVSWSASTDSASSLWLAVTPGSGTGSGTNVLSVSVNAATLTSGTYQGSVTLQVSDGNGPAVQGSPLTIPITLTVT
jgi:hypothetical protein